MRISDWNSDVCSSDLGSRSRRGRAPAGGGAGRALAGRRTPRTVDARRLYGFTGLRILRLRDGPGGLGAGGRRLARTGVRQTHPMSSLRGEQRRSNPSFVRVRKSVVAGKSVSVRLDLGGRCILKKTTPTKTS